MTFLTPLFLAGLAALAVPVVLHLMHRPIPRRIVFPTIRFIKKGQEFQSGKKGLRDLLTLLMRLLILAALVLLFAGPMLVEDDAAAIAQGQRRMILIYDLSASMNAADFEVIAERTDELLSRDATVPVALLASSDQLEVSLPFTTDHASILTAVRGLTPTMRAGQHGAMQQRLRQLLQSGEGAETTIHLFSDLQRNDWANIELLSGDMGAATDVVFERPFDVTPGNLAIMNVVPEIFENAAGRQLRATVTIQNFSVAPAAATLRLVAGGRQVEQRIEIAADTSSKYVVEMADPVGTGCVAELEVDEPYQLDNRYHFWIGRNPPVNGGIVVAGQSGAQLIQAFFLRQALETQAPGALAFNVQTVQPSVVFEEDLRQFQVLFFLDSLSDYSAIEYDILHDFLKAGGIIVYLAGPKAPETFISFRRAGLTSVRFNGWLGDANQLQSRFISDFNKQSPVLAPFAVESADLTLIPIYRMGRFDAPAPATTLLTVDGEHPLMTEEHIGEGFLFLVATSLSPQWSELPTSMSFLPIIRRLAAAGLGENYRRVITLEAGQDPAAFLDMAGLRVTGEVKSEPGVYVADGVPVEVNITRSESDLQPAEAFNLLQRGAPPPAEGESAGIAAAGSGGTSLRPLLALLLMGFFCLEILTANFRTS